MYCYNRAVSSSAGGQGADTLPNGIPLEDSTSLGALVMIILINALLVRRKR
jgi:hypothetical protein